MNNAVEPIPIILAILAVFLITQRWFWLFIFGLGYIASVFATLASIFHFQILSAIGFLFLTGICFLITMLIAES